MFKFVVLCAALAIARAGYLAPAAPAVSYSTYAAAPALRYAAAAPAYGYAAAAPAYGYAAAAPAVSYAAAAPAVSYQTQSFGAPAIHAAPAVAYGHAPIAATAVVGQQSNILRSFGNLGTVSTYSKTLDTPFASVSKSDVRVSNPGYRLAAPVATYAHAPAIAAAPVAHTSYHGNGFGLAAPAAVGYGGALGYSGYAAAAPVAYGRASYGYAAAAPVAYGHAGYGVAAAAPLAYGRTAYAGGLGYSAGLGYAAGYAGGYAGLGYAHATPAVSHVSYTGNYGSYAW